MISVAKYIYVGCHSVEQENYYIKSFTECQLLINNSSYRTRAHLYYTIIHDNNYHCCLRGLLSGAMGRLIYVECYDAGEVTHIQLKYHDSPKVGKKTKSRCMETKNLSCIAVPIVHIINFNQ